MEQLLIGTKCNVFNSSTHNYDVYRVCSINGDEVTLKDKNNKSIKRSKLKSKISPIIPDEFMIIMHTVDVPDKESKIEYKDMFIECIDYEEYIKNKYVLPNMIMRQNVYNGSIEPVDNTINIGAVYFSEQITPDTIGDIMQFTDIKYMYQPIALYVEDTANDILSLIDTIKIDRCFKDTIPQDIKDVSYSGYCASLREFFDIFEFSKCFRISHHITPVDFTINLGNNVDESGVVTINDKQKTMLDEALGCTTSKINLISYDRDLEMSNLIGTTHALICDPDFKIYLCIYTRMC